MYPQYLPEKIFCLMTKTETTTTNFSRPFTNIAGYIENMNVDGCVKFYKGITESEWLAYSKKNLKNGHKAAIALTQVAIKQSLPDDIITYCEDAIEEDGTYYLPYYHGALAYSAKGKSDKAIEYFRNAILYNHDFVQAYYQLAIEYNNVGKIAESEDCLLQTLKLDPNNAEAEERLSSLKKEKILRNEFKIDNVNIGRVRELVKDEDLKINSDKRKRRTLIAVFINITSLLILTCLFLILKKDYGKKMGK